MRHLIPSFIRVPVVFFIIVGLVEYFVDSGDQPAFMEQPIIILLMMVIVQIKLYLMPDFQRIHKINPLLEILQVGHP